MKEATATSTRENLEHMRATFNNIESAQSPPSFTKQREASGDVGFERDMPEIMNFVRPGFLKGTPIALADGSAKPIGQINYEDKLLVWNFDTENFDEALALLIEMPVIATEFTAHYFSANTSLYVIGDCRYLCDNEFAPSSQETTVNSTTAFTSSGNNIELLERTKIHDDAAEFYCVITSNHFNMFANNILVSIKLNVDVYTIASMRFHKSSSSTSFTPRELNSNLSESTFEALRLSEQTVDPIDAAEFVTNFAKLQVPRPKRHVRPQGRPVGSNGNCPMQRGFL